MRRFALFLILLLFVLPSFAQVDEQSPYEIALARIEEARVSQATSLDLSGLGLTELPPELWNLSNLEGLGLQENQLSELPHEIGNLTQLKYLPLHTNLLQSLPPEIGNLLNLELLELGGNQLTVLPPEIGNLRSLGVLDLRANQLESLPPEIGKLSNLCTLLLEFNQISYLPVELSQISQANFERPGCYIAPHGNPLISPPQEVIDQGTPAILAYLRNQTWWHINRLIAGAASSVGLVAAIVLGFRWKNRRGKAKEKRRV